MQLSERLLVDMLQLKHCLPLDLGQHLQLARIPGMRGNNLQHNIRLNTIGEVERLPNSVNAMLKETMQATENNTGMVLNLALSYGARSEIVRMVQQLSETVSTAR